MTRCLIVDDSSCFLEAARMLLESQGVAVVGLASNGTDALRQVTELRPDVVLLDVGLGSESGFEVAKRLAREVRGTPPPTIMISTFDEEDYASLVAASPAVGFVPKMRLSARVLQDVLDGVTGRPGT